MAHIPVLLKESIDGLKIRSGDIVLDGTLGGGGHTTEIAKKFGTGVKIIGLDLDADAIPRAKASLEGIPHDTIFRTTSFTDFKKVLNELNMPHVDRILLDLGISSFQLEDSGRGFTFRKDEPLLMTMKKDPSGDDTTAYEVVNTWDEETLADIIFGFGEDRYSRRIAKAIVTARQLAPIDSTKKLADIVENAVPKNFKSKIHPATKTFQAIRIAVNMELSSIEKSIPELFGSLSSGGRLAIISFHSLEDRIVKKAFKKLKDEKLGEVTTKKPIVPNEEELKENPRARSAKLRIIEKF